MEFVPIAEFAGKRVISGLIDNDFKITDPEDFLLECYPSFHRVVNEKLDEYGSLKLNVELATDYIIKKGDEEKIIDMFFNTKMKIVNRSMDLWDFFEENVLDTLLERLFDFEHGESGKALSCIHYLQINICVFDPVNGTGSSFIPLPNIIKGKQACVNVKNNDFACFAWAIVSALYPAKRHVDRCSSYPSYRTVLNLDGVTLPMPINEKKLKYFEDLNDISINIYTLDEKQERIVGPIFYTENKREKHVNLLYYSDSTGEKFHFVWIKDLGKLVGSQLSKNTSKKFICDRCLLYFSSKETFTKHEEDCASINGPVRLTLPEPGENCLKFKNFKHKIKMPFVIYADTECLCVPINDDKADKIDPRKKSYRVKKQVHVPYAIGWVLKYFLHDDYENDFFQITSGPNCVEDFVLKLKEVAKLVNNVYDNPYPIIMTQEDWENFDNADRCHICERLFSETGEPKVRDHLHFKGPPSNYVGAACQSCNVNYFPDKRVNVYFHNGSHYDFKILVRAIANADPEVPIDVIPLNNENYVSFTVRYSGVQFRFLDSYRFLGSSLDALVKTTDKNELRMTQRFFTGSKFDLMREKGVFPYEYVTSFEKLEETSLPPKDQFFSSLTEQGITDEEYDRALKVWDAMGCDTLGSYAEAYLQSDVTLLADVFENFRTLAMKTDGLDPAWYYTLPGFSYDSMLKLTKIELELLTDGEMLLFFEKAIRGGLSQCSYRYAAANNPYMKNYDPSRDETYIWYLDINNLYGWALSQPLPYGNFEWIKPEKFNDFLNVESINTKKNGYFYEVDISIPTNLHKFFKDLPLAPTHEVPPGSKHPKLLATLRSKSKYVIHIETLKLYVRLGLKIDRIHRVLKFDHSDWMQQYIMMNTRLRERATNSFEKNYYKLKNNAVYGKTIENVRKRRDIKIVRKWLGRGQARKRIASPHFKKITIFSEDLAAIELKKTEVFYDKPIYVGVSVLDLSKSLLYDMFYNKIRPSFGDKMILMYVDTDSYIFKILDVNPYLFLKQNPDLFDTSEYEEDNPYGIVRANQKKIGLVKDETAGKIVAEFVGLRSKMYAYRLEGRDDSLKKAKGLGRSVVKRLTFQDFKNCLFPNIDYEPEYKKQRMIRSDHLVLFTVEENKLTLSGNDDKRRIAKDGIDTFPFGFEEE